MCPMPARNVFRSVGVDVSDKDQFSDKETKERAEAALKRMLKTPPKLHKDSKVGKRKPKP